MEIIEKDDLRAVKFDKPGVAVISYTLDESGVINAIGVVKETNSLFEKGYTENLVMGGVETDDTSLLQRAAKELKEEGGLEVADVKKWSYLGDIFISKMCLDPVHLFSVDVSGLTPQVPQGDGHEKIISFSLMPVQDALKIGDSILVSAFFKLFLKIYKKELTPLAI